MRDAEVEGGAHACTGQRERATKTVRSDCAPRWRAHDMPRGWGNIPMCGVVWHSLRTCISCRKASYSQVRTVSDSRVTKNLPGGAGKTDGQRVVPLTVRQMPPRPCRHSVFQLYPGVGHSSARVRPIYATRARKFVGCVFMVEKIPDLSNWALWQSCPFCRTFVDRAHPVSLS